MNKKILALALASAMAISSTAAFAEVGGTITKDAPALDMDMQVMMPEQGVPAYVRHDAVVKEVKDDAILLDMGDELPETATVSEETVVFTATGDVAELTDVKEGANVSVFVDGNAAVPLINPPQYPAS